MNLSELARAVYQRIKSDTGAGGLLNNPDGLLYDAGRAAYSRLRRNYATDIEATVANGLPIVVVTVPEFVNDGGLNFDGARGTVRVQIFGKPPIDSGDDGDDGLAVIQDRIFGDATTRTDKTPTYGLHRWNTGTLGDWGGGTFAWERTEQEYSENIVTFSMYFKVGMVRQSPGQP